MEQLAQGARKANAATKQDIRSLRDALLQLQRQQHPVSQRLTKGLADSTKPANELLTAIRDALALADAPIGIPKAVSDALACTRELIKGTHIASCPGRQELIQEYFDEKDRTITTSRWQH
jgi:hypothetical protein